MEYGTLGGGFDSALDLAKVAYIKRTPSAEAHRLGLLPPGMVLPPDAQLYVLHLGDGTVIGITDDWNSAYGTMVQNDLTPVSLH
ncbi:MAG: DUF1150 family protein [Rhizomicrobium sp.]